MSNSSGKRIFPCATKLVLLTSVAATMGIAQAQAEPEPIAPDWNNIRYKDHTLNFHGYFRTSYGGDFAGENVMPVFQAPGANSKFRLGNESDTNIELGLNYNYYLDGAGNDNSRFIQLLGMVSDYESNPNYEDVQIEFNEAHIPQAFFRLGNFLDDGTHVWFGRRYYDRRDIHMNDHFWLNVSQGAEFGGGIEGINIGNQRLDIAAFHNEDDTLTDLSGATANTDNLDTYTLDVRYRDIPTIENGDLTLFGLYSYRDEVDSIGYNSEDGLMVGGWHTQNEFMGGRMVTGFYYRQGTAMQQGLFNSKPVREDQGYDLDKNYAIELNNDYLYQSEDYAVQWATVLHQEEQGTAGGNDKITWAQTGVRPVFFLNDYVSIATELGVDYVDNELINADGYLGKATLALQLTRGKGFFERPMVKAFVTGAKWSEDFEGQIGGSPAESTSYLDDTAGVSFGIQFETWW
ncbi:MAG: carbohydrate porin [Micavibrio sp.]|nr:carbohydrate porin [Micavibrio sp.]